MQQYGVIALLTSIENCKHIEELILIKLSVARELFALLLFAEKSSSALELNFSSFSATIMIYFSSTSTRRVPMAFTTASIFKIKLFNYLFSSSNNSKSPLSGNTLPNRCSQWQESNYLLPLRLKQNSWSQQSQAPCQQHPRRKHHSQPARLWWSRLFLTIGQSVHIKSHIC